MQKYEGKRVLITGASGFIGQHLVSALDILGTEYAVINRSVRESDRSSSVFIGDIKNNEFIKKTFRYFRPNVIFHLAANRARDLSLQTFRDSIDTNILGAVNVLFSAIDCSDVERVVILGTGEEYGNNITPFSESMREAPVSAYSYTKQSVTQLAQLVARSYSLPVCVLRPSIAYGPGQRHDMFIPEIIRSMIKNESFPMTFGEQTRDFVYIDDLVRAIISAGINSDVNGEIINIGSGEAVSIRKVVEHLAKITGMHGLANMGAIDYRNGEIMKYQLDISKAKKLLDWMPVISLPDGLQKTFRWYADN